MVTRQLTAPGDALFQDNALKLDPRGILLFESDDIAVRVRDDMHFTLVDASDPLDSLHPNEPAIKAYGDRVEDGCLSGGVVPYEEVELRIESYLESAKPLVVEQFDSINPHRKLLMVSMV